MYVQAVQPEDRREKLLKHMMEEANWPEEKARECVDLAFEAHDLALSSVALVTARTEDRRVDKQATMLAMQLLNVTAEDAIAALIPLGKIIKSKEAM